MANPTNTLETRFTADVTNALKGINEFKEALESVGKKAAAVIKDFSKLDVAIEKSIKAFDKSVQAVQKFQASLTKLNKSFGDVSDKVAKSQAEMAASSASTERAAAAVTVYEQALGTLQNIFHDQPVVLRKLTNELNKLENEYWALTAGGKDLSKTLTWQYDAQTLVKKSIENWIENTKTLTAQQKNLIEANAHLNTGLTNASFSQTILGKAILSTYQNGQLFYNALVKGGIALGVNTSKTFEYVQALKEVYKHLQSVSKNSINYSSAVKELKNSEDLHTRAMQLMNGEISKVSNGFLAMHSSVAETGTVMTSYRYNLDQITQANQKLLPVYNALAEKYKNQPLMLSAATNSLIQYSEVQEKLRTIQRQLLEGFVEASNGVVQYGGKLVQGQELTRKLNAEKSRLTQLLNNESTVLRFLSSGYENTEKGLMQFIQSNMKGTLTYREFQKELTGFNDTIKKLGEYNEVYANSFKRSASAVLENKGQVEASAQAHLKYARTAEQLIFQMNEYVRIGREKAKMDYAANRDIGQYRNSIKELYSQQRILTETLRSLETVSRSVSQANNINTSSLLEHAKAAGLSRDTAFRLTNVLDGLNSRYIALAPFVDKLRASVLSGNMEFDRAKKVLDALEKSHEAYLQSLEKNVSWTDKLVKKVKEFTTYYAAATAIYMVTVALREGVLAIANFDQTLYDLQAILGSTRGEVKALGEEMQKASAKTIYSIQEISDGVKLMGQAGLDTQQIIQSLAPTLNLAMGTLEKMEPVVDLLTSTMVSFGKQAFQVSEIADVMAMAINRSKLDVEKLRTVFNYIGVTAAQAGLSLQETAASAMILADAGLKASTIGTSLRNVISKLIAPNVQLRQTLQEIGQQTSDLNPLVVGYERALENLSKVLSVNSIALDGTTQRTLDAGKAYEMFGLRGAQAALALVNAFLSGKYQETLESLDETGVAAKMAKIQMEGLEARFKNLVANSKLLAVALGDAGVTAALKGFISVLNAVVKSIGFFLDVWNKTFIGDIGKAIVIAIAAFKTFSLAAELTFVKTAVYAVNTFIASFLAGQITIGTIVSGIILRLNMLKATLMSVFITHPIAAFLAVLTTLAGVMLLVSNAANRQTEKMLALGTAFTNSKNTLDAFLGGLKEISLRSKEQKDLVDKLSGKFVDFERELARTSKRASLSDMSFKDLTSSLSELHEEFGDTEAYRFYKESIENAIKGTKAYQNAFKELKEEFPDLYAKLQKTAEKLGFARDGFDESSDSSKKFKKEIDLTKLSLSELDNLFQRVQTDQFTESLDSLGEVLQKKVNTGVEDYVHLTDWMTDSMSGASDAHSVATISVEQYDRAVKTTRDTLIQYALLKGNITKQEIENELAKRNVTIQATKDIMKGLMEEIEFRKMALKTREDITKKHKTLIEGLTVFEKVEFQKTMRQYDEEAAAFKKMVDAKEIAEEDFEAVMIALRQKYHMKALQLISDASKKENETTDQKYKRERDLLVRQMEYIMSENRNLEKSLLDLKEKNKGHLDKQIKAQTMVLENGLKEEQKLREKYAAIEIEHYTNVSKRILDVLKADIALQTAIITRREDEKLKIEIDAAEQEYNIVKETLDKIRALYGEHDSRTVEAMNREVEARRNVLEKQYKLIEFYLSKYEEAYNSKQNYIQDFYTKERESVQRSYDEYVDGLERRLQKDKEWVDRTIQNKEEAEKRKAFLEKQYYDSLISASESKTNREIELVKRETDETIEAIKEKYKLRAQFLNQELAVTEDVTTKIAKSSWKITDETKDALRERKTNFVEHNGQIYVLEEQAVEKVKNLQQSRTDLDKKVNSEILEARRKGLEEIRKIYESEKSFLESRYNAEKSHLDSLLAKRQSYIEQLKGLERSFQSEIFDLQTENMSAYEKYSATVQRVNELLNQARLSGDVEYVREAKNLTKSLAKEVVDENGRVIKSTSETTNLKKQLLTEAYNLEKGIIEQQKKNVEDQITTTKNALDSLQSKLTEYRDKIAEISKQELALKKDEVEKSLTEVKNNLESLDLAIAKARKLEIDTKSFQDSIDQAKRSFDELNAAFEKSMKSVLEIEIKEAGSDKKASEALDDVKKKVNDVKKTTEETKVKIDIEVSLTTGSKENKPVIQGLSDIQDKIKAIENKAGSQINFSINVKGKSNDQDAEISSLLTFILDQANQLVDKAVTYTIKVIGLESLKEAVDYQNSLHDTTTTHTIITRYETEGGESKREGGLIGAIQKFAKGGFSGSLPGFGGGDIIPAMLEPGEFVLRKESVQKYGLKFFKMLNEMKLPSMILPRFETGGLVASSNHGSDSPMQIIEFRIDSTSHRLYGDSDTIRNLTNSLRRSRLVTV